MSKGPKIGSLHQATSRISLLQKRTPGKPYRYIDNGYIDTGDFFLFMGNDADRCLVYVLDGRIGEIVVYRDWLSVLAKEISDA